MYNSNVPSILPLASSKSKSKKTLFKVGQCKQTTLALTLAGGSWGIAGSDGKCG